MLTELSELAHKTRHWGGRENIWTLQQKYLRSKKIASLVCYLIADAAAAGLLPGLPEGAHYVVQVRLGVIHCAASHSLQKRKISLSIKSGVMNVDDEHACDTEHQDIKASNIRQIERTQQQIFFAFKIFFLENTSEASGHGEVCCGCARVNF